MSRKRTTTPAKTRAAPAPAAAPTPSRRSRHIGPRPTAIYDAASGNPLIPRVYDPSPTVTDRQQRALQVLASHLYRNDPFIRNLVNAACRIYVGSGPTPLSRFPELDDLWMACSGQFDNTGRRDFGGWLRQDVYRGFRIKGEVFVRRRKREEDAPEFGGLIVPVEFEAHGSEFCPIEYNQIHRGLPYVSGIGSVRSKPVWYAFWTSHPGEGGLNAPQIIHLPRSEIYHVFDPMTASARGEVMLASALLRAIKISTLEDSELRRKQVAALTSIWIERPLDHEDDTELFPTPDEVEGLMDAVALSPGAVNQLPAGYKMNSFTPSDEPASFEKALRWQLMAICASVGIPVNEVTGDDGVERWGRMMSQRVQSQATLEHGMLEHQLLNRMRADFVDQVMEAGMWLPPVDIRPWELYECDWQWPVIPAARLDQELGALMGAVDKGHLPHSHVARTLFGLSPQIVARTSARDAARADTLGLQWTDPVWRPDTDVAMRIAAAAVVEETAERDLVDAAGIEDSILDDDVD